MRFGKEIQMNDADEKVDVVLPDDQTGADAKADEPVVEVQIDLPLEAAAEEQNTNEDEDLQKSLKKLKKKYEREKEARKEAEQRAKAEAARARQAMSEVDSSNIQLIESAIHTVKQQNEVYTAKYAEAMSVGDYDAAAKIQRLMSTNEAKLLQLENGKTAMVNNPRQETAPAADPVEHFASQLSPRSADWIRKNPQCVTDPRLMQKMIAAHNLAVADGYQADSDDYFKFVEKTIGLRKKDRVEDDHEEDSALSSASKPVSRQAPPPAAPANNGGSNRPNVVRLTKAEAETARMFGMTEQEYAKHKVALQKEGKLAN
jgi:hypothetical protein